jgi:galactose mutarotase-like enzyme
MLQLSRGDDSLILAPEFGGSIVGWTRRGTQMFRRASPEAVMLGRPNAMGCFPQVPFCNRIAWRRFNWAGQTYELAANFGDRPHAIHGVGWQRPRRIQETLSHSTGCGFPMLSGLASRNNQAKTLGLPRRCDDFVILWVGV